MINIRDAKREQIFDGRTARVTVVARHLLAFQLWRRVRHLETARGFRTINQSYARAGRKVRRAWLVTTTFQEEAVVETTSATLVRFENIRLP